MYIMIHEESFKWEQIRPTTKNWFSAVLEVFQGMYVFGHTYNVPEYQEMLFIIKNHHKRIIMAQQQYR